MQRHPSSLPLRDYREVRDKWIIGLTWSFRRCNDLADMQQQQRPQRQHYDVTTICCDYLSFCAEACCLLGPAKHDVNVDSQEESRPAHVESTQSAQDVDRKTDRSQRMRGTFGVPSGLMEAMFDSPARRPSYVRASRSTGKDSDDSLTLQMQS